MPIEPKFHGSVGSMALSKPFPKTGEWNAIIVVEEGK
jgi:hypothetical protein